MGMRDAMAMEVQAFPLHRVDDDQALKHREGEMYNKVASWIGETESEAYAKTNPRIS